MTVISIFILVLIVLLAPNPLNLIAWLLICAILIYRVAKLW